MREKRIYTYVASYYNYKDENGVRQTCYVSYLCDVKVSDNPSGIPSCGNMIYQAKTYCEEHGYKYIEGSLFILSIIKLTKAQFNALNDKQVKPLEY